MIKIIHTSWFVNYLIKDILSTMSPAEDFTVVEWRPKVILLIFDSDSSVGSCMNSNKLRAYHSACLSAAQLHPNSFCALINRS